MQQFLQKCARIEELVGDVYRLLAAAESLPAELRGILRKLAADEDEHVQKIRLALRLQREEILTGVNLPEQRVEALLAQVRAMHDDLRRRAIDEEEALHLAARLEQDFSQVHIEAVAEFADPGTRAMFRALAVDDDEHTAALQRYLAGR